MSDISKKMDLYGIPLRYRGELAEALSNGNTKSVFLRYPDGWCFYILNGYLETVVASPRNNPKLKKSGITYYVYDVNPNAYGDTLGGINIQGDELCVTNNLDEAQEYVENYIKAVKEYNHVDKEERKYCSLDENSIEVYKYDGKKATLVEEQHYDCEHQYYSDSDSNTETF